MNSPLRDDTGYEGYEDGEEVPYKLRVFRDGSQMCYHQMITAHRVMLDDEQQVAKDTFEKKQKVKPDMAFGQRVSKRSRLEKLEAKRAKKDVLAIEAKKDRLYDMPSE